HTRSKREWSSDVCSSDLTSMEKDELTHSIAEAYIGAIVEAGGIPLVLPNVQDETAIKAYAQEIDGLLGTGGYDIDPMHYREEPRSEERRVGKEVRNLWEQ